VLALTQPGAPEGPHAIALDLLAAAHYDPDTMAHALSLGHTYLDDHPGDGAAQNGAGILRTAIELLGARPRADDAASTGGSPCGRCDDPAAAGGPGMAAAVSVERPS
jgi:hypothetical protein